MRRLQANLSYLASLADKKINVTKHPAYLTAPVLHFNIKIRGATPGAEDTQQDPPLDASQDREQRDKLLKELYATLQALFPGIDPTKEPTLANAAGGNKQPHGQAHQQQGLGGVSTTSQPSSTAPTPSGTPQMTSPSVLGQLPPVAGS